MKRVRIAFTIVALATLPAVPIFAQDDAKISKGKTVFAAQKCTMCHAIEGKGNKNAPLDGVGGKLSADDIKKWIVSPKDMKADTKMKAYPSLTPEDLDALVTYLSSLKK
jgi:cytochrome c oxidase subunit 2